jgi:hypothetical protein
MAGTIRLRQSPSTPWRRVGGEVVLAPPGREDFDVLAGTGAVVWELLDEPRTVAEVVGVLAELYGMAEGDIDGDVGELVSALVQTGAIEEIGEADAAGG